MQTTCNPNRKTIYLIFWVNKHAERRRLITLTDIVDSKDNEKTWSESMQKYTNVDPCSQNKSN